MRPAMSVMSLLLLLLLLANRSEGIRFLEEESQASLHKDVHEKEVLAEEGSTGIGGGLVCGSQRHCSGKSRKLMTDAMATSKSERNNDMSVDSAQNNHKGEVDRSRDDLHTAPAPPASKQVQTYPDILDIAGMDYSPAKRKPPIHN